jgi:hypothetical protein
MVAEMLEITAVRLDRIASRPALGHHHLKERFQVPRRRGLCARSVWPHHLPNPMSAKSGLTVKALVGNDLLHRCHRRRYFPGG